MVPTNLSAFLSEWSGPISAGFGAITGWLGNVAKNRLQQQRNAIDAEQLDNEQLQLALARERFLTDRLMALGNENETLWARLYIREGVLKDYHSAALTARRQVHELEIRLGIELTIFADFPEFPPDDNDKEGAFHGKPPMKDHDDDRDDASNVTNYLNTTCSPMGRRQTAPGQKDHCPPE